MARRRAGLAEPVEVLAHGRAPTSELVAVAAVEVVLHYPHPVPGDVELLGHDERQRGLHSLPDLRILGRDGDQAVGPDLDEGTERATRESVHGAGERAQHQQAAGRGGGDLKEIAALHQAAPPAARWIAARIRW